MSQEAQHEQERRRWMAESPARGRVPEAAGPPRGVASHRFSRQPLARLEPIRLCQLRLGFVHTCKYVLCRTLVTPCKLRAVATVVTDGPAAARSDGDDNSKPAASQLRLLVHNLNAPMDIMTDHTRAASRPHHDLPPGTVLAIKEPYLAAPGSCPGGSGPLGAASAAGGHGGGDPDSQPFLRVDSPMMDLLVISDPRHPLVAGTAWEEDVRAAAAAAAADVGSGCGVGASRQLIAGATAGSTAGDADGAAQWQLQGNALFGSGHFVDALHAYQQGLAALQQAGQHPGDQQPGDQQPEEQQPCSEQLTKGLAILLNNSAAACLGFGAYESARVYAQLALRWTPRDATTLLHLAKALDGLGRYSEAADACQDHLNSLASQLQSSNSNSNSNSSGLGLAVTAAFTDGQRLLQSLQQQVAEAERGEYNEAGMAREAAASTTPRLERHADFIGPVQVADAGEGRGRGLYTTAPVRAGQLLLAMRADVVSFAADVNTSTVCCDERAAADVAALGAASAQLKWDLPSAVLGCGRLAARLAHLHAGGQARVPPVPPVAECGFVLTWRPVAVAGAGAGAALGASGSATAQTDGGAAEGSSDSCGEEAIAAARVFELLAVQGGAAGRAAQGGPPPSAVQLGLLKAPPNGSRVRVDQELLARLCVANGFAFDQLLPLHVAAPAPAPAASGPAAAVSMKGGHDSCQRAGGDKANDSGGGSAGKPTATGLWGLASYFNHACVANAHRYFLGDFLFVRASRDLPAGAEVTITYLNPTLPWEQRSAKLLRRGFACGCELCIDETDWRRRHPDEAQQLEGLLARVERLCAAAAAACPVAEGATGPDPALVVVAGAAVAATADHSAAAAMAVCWQKQEQRAQEPWVARARGVLEELAGAALRGRGWRSTLVGPASRLARVLRACGDLCAAARARELAFHSLCHCPGARFQQPGAQQLESQAEAGRGAASETADVGIMPGAAAAGAGSAATSPAAGQAVAGAEVAAAAGSERVLSPEAAVQAAMDVAAAWRQAAGAGSLQQQQRGEEEREVARQRARLWEVTARGLWARYFGGNQDLFEARFGEALELNTGVAGDGVAHNYTGWLPSQM